MPRLTAEDVANGVHAEPRPADALRACPSARGLRVDTHCYDGAVIPPYYDSLMAKLIAHGDGPRCGDRRSCSRRSKALDVEGVETNRALLAGVLGAPRLRGRGRSPQRWLEEEAITA